MRSTGEAFEFGPFRLEPGERRLVQGTQPVAITPKAFDLLVILVENAGRLLKKEDLIERLWPGVFVEEVNLAQNISALRRALGGDGREAFIQTVAGAGYRFAAEVRQPPAVAAAPRAFRERLLVLPFRMLKPDPELDFLAFSLPDALTVELSSLDSVIVRSSLVAARFAGDTPDLARIAREAHVDFVVSGTVLRAGNQLRVSAQLSDAAGGSVIWSHAAQAPIDDLFQLQDSLVSRIAGSLSAPLTAPDERRLRHDVPATPKAYELFLRANQASPFAFAIDRVIAARDLYLQSIGEDAAYAPTWARLARMYRLLGKYVSDDAGANLARADDALQRALALNPDLSMAHSLYAQIDVDRGQAPEAMRRLLERLARRGPHEELYAGLVQACRFCGLLDESVAAHQEASRLDPAIATSVMHTYFVMRRYQEALDSSGDIKAYVYPLSLHALGRGDEAMTMFAELERKGPLPPLLLAARELIAGRYDESAAALASAIKTFSDPEAFFYGARHLAHLGQVDAAIAALEKSVDGGYSCVEPLIADPWLEPARDRVEFRTLLGRARERHQSALKIFRAVDGARHLGMAT